MTAPQIGIAIVGTGFGQKIHIPGFQSHHRTHVVAVYHRDLVKAEAIAQAHEIPVASDSLEAIAENPQVHAFSISTPPFLHFQQAQIALKAGKHLLLEKPTTLNVGEVKQLQAMAIAQSSVTAIDFEFRFIPTWQRLAELMAEGFVGQKRLIKIDWLVSSRADAKRAWNWYAHKDQGGGALGAMGSHTFDYVAWLFGPVKRLWANLSTTIPLRPDPSSGEQKPVTSDDTCNLLLELADGTPCQINLSSVTHQGRGHWVEVYGDRGTLIVGNDNQADYVHGFKLWAAPSGQSLSEVEIPERLAFPRTYPDGRLAPFIRVVDQWVKGIDQGQSLTPSLQEGIYSRLLMDLTHQSNQSGSWVRVPD